MANGSIGMSGYNFDAFVSSQRTFNDYDLAAKIQEKYWRARQKFLAKVEKKEDACIVLSDSKLDSKLEIYRSIDNSCAKLTNILESYQNSLFVYANEENSLSILLKECSKHDKTKAGKIMAIAGKSLTQSSHQNIRLYMPLMRLYQEMETFHTRAVEDTAETVQRLENKRSQYRASLLWMKDISERLDPDIYSKLDKFRRVQNQVRSDKKAFDGLQMDVVQKIDLLMASRCNLLNQILASYQATLLETFEKNYNNFRTIEELIKKEDIYEYEFKALKQLNPLKITDLEENQVDTDTHNTNKPEQTDDSPQLIDVCLEENNNVKHEEINLMQDDSKEDNELDELEALFGKISAPSSKPVPSSKLIEEESNKNDSTSNTTSQKPNLHFDLLNMDNEEQIANLLAPSETTTQLKKQNLNIPEAKDFDLMGEVLEQPESDNKNGASIDLLTNELYEIDNSSYFKSLQTLNL